MLLDKEVLSDDRLGATRPAQTEQHHEQMDKQVQDGVHGRRESRALSYADKIDNSLISGAT